MSPGACVILSSFNWTGGEQTRVAVVNGLVSVMGYADEVFRIEDHRIPVKDIFNGYGVDMMYQDSSWDLKSGTC